LGDISFLQKVGAIYSSLQIDNREYHESKMSKKSNELKKQKVEFLAQNLIVPLLASLFIFSTLAFLLLLII
jgi:hypothetical protein